MNPREIFLDYVAERRTQAIAGFQLEVRPHLVRHTATEPGGGGIVTFADLPPGQEVARIREELAWFRERGQPFEWKVYDLDRPADLRSVLEAEGFTAGIAEAFMVTPLDRPDPPPPRGPAGARIVKADSPEAVRDLVAVQRSVWNRDFSWLEARLARVLRERPGEISAYCAYLADRPVGTGWTDFPPRSGYAELHGGAVLPELRGQGVYSMLYHRRREEARRRGCRFLAVDAAPMSRPILERKGFAVVCRTFPMHSPPPA